MTTRRILPVFAIAFRGPWLGLLAALGVWLLSGCGELSGGGSRRDAEAVGRDCPPDEEGESSAAMASAAAPLRVRTNRLGIKLVWIPPGEFLMGSPRYEEDRDDDETQHRVRITRPFYLGQYEVTVGQFRRFVSESGYRTDRETTPVWEEIPHPEIDVVEYRYCTWRDPGFTQTDDFPVTRASWNDATAFCRWLSAREGEEYRLPTEAEWEYACRAGTRTRFSTGNADTSLFRAGQVIPLIPNGMGGYVSQPGRTLNTSPVGSFDPNHFGLYDVHGNVWEWCADWYGAEYYRHSPTEDPEGPASGEHRVMRGGCYVLYARYARSANRYRGSPSLAFGGTGFRVATSAGATAPLTAPTGRADGAMGPPGPRAGETRPAPPAAEGRRRPGAC